MKGKVIYISFVHLSPKFSRDWNIDYLISKDVNVEYWDLVDLFFGKDSLFQNSKIVRTPNSYSEIESWLYLPENSKATFVLAVNYEGRFAKLFRLLAKHDAVTVTIKWGSAPKSQGSRRTGILLRVFSDPLLVLRQVFYKMKGISYKKLHIVKPFDIAFAAGGVLAGSGIHSKKIIPVNLIDYDNFKKTSSTERLYEPNYAVFLDINLPYQSDLKICRLTAVNPEDYYKSLNNFFDLVEEKFNVKVVIAAHPSAKYTKDLFHHREIFSGLTPELVKYSEFVINHHSTAISYAVLNLKPVLFIYTNEMRAKYGGSVLSSIFDFADSLKANVYNVDEVISVQQIEMSKLDLDLYNNYKYNFLTTPESEERSTQEIFWNELKKVQHG